MPEGRRMEAVPFDWLVSYCDVLCYRYDESDLGYIQFVLDGKKIWL